MQNLYAFLHQKKWWVILVGGLGFLVLAVLWLRRAVRQGGRLVRPVNPADFLRDRPESTQVVPIGEERVLIRWPQETGRVTIHCGNRPETIDWHNTLLTVEAGHEAEVPIRDPHQRVYYGLEFADGRREIVAERTLPLQGNGNFRDLGGYRTEEGRMTRWGRVFRSGTLARLTPADVAYLEQLDLKIICDFRSEAEQERDPNRLPAGVDYRSMPIVNENPIASALHTILFRRHLLGQLMVDSYYGLIDEGAPFYGRLLGLLADENNLPLVFHCAAGKDRAGVAAALLLKALGVPEETILADYSMSNQIFDFLTREFADEMAPILRLGVPMEELHYPLMADPAWLAEILAHIEDHYGGIEAYLTGPAGLAPETLAAIRKNLLVSGGQALA